MKVYNDVNLDDATGSLQADSILYDLEKKYITVNNFDDKAIKMKVIQWAKSKNSKLQNTKKKLNLFYKWKIFRKDMANKMYYKISTWI